MAKKWLLKRTKIDTFQMAKMLGVRQTTATVLANRNIDCHADAMDFLFWEGGEYASIHSMKDMEKGISLLAEAIEEKEKIVVYGDYDVDGVMSTSILYQVISHCGGEVSYYLPHRQEEGYGLNEEAVRELACEGAKVLFPCDNGIAAIGEIALAKELGMTVVVLDHHEPGFEGEGETKIDILPMADAVIDPKQRDCQYPFPFLCAGGLAYFFAIELMKKMGMVSEERRKEWVTLASVATVCDIVDLTGENRKIVKEGLSYCKDTKNLGLQALIAETGLSEKAISEYHFGFVLGPCINATGRLESAKLAVALFCEKDMEMARTMARELIGLNQVRREMTEVATQKVLEQIQEEKRENDSVLVLYQKDIHESIAGIVAGRIKERYYRPTIVITKAENGAKGSGRSIEGYNLFEELFSCRHLFQRFGGHPMAAGLSLEEKNIDRLRELLNERSTLTEEQMKQPIRLERVLCFSEIDFGLAAELKGLSPFGKANPTPLFVSRGIYIDHFSLMGKNKNMLRFQFLEKETGAKRNGVSFDGYFTFHEMLIQLHGESGCDKIIEAGRMKEPMDIVYTVDINSYQGRHTVQLVVKDFRFST